MTSGLAWQLLGMIRSIPAPRIEERRAMEAERGEERRSAMADNARYLGSAPMRHLVIHVSGDYPDAVNIAKTLAIRRLTELVSDRFDQRVVSLNRTSVGLGFAWRALLSPRRPPLDLSVEDDGSIASVGYAAPGRGIYHHAMLRELGEWLAEHVERGPRPRLLVAHKLGIEGLAVAEAARRLHLPYALVIQGNTDARIIRTRPDLRPALRRVYHDAAVAFPLAPWTLSLLDRHLGRRAGPTIILPCPMSQDTMQLPRDGDGTIVSVYHLRNYRGKNTTRLVRAADAAHARNANLRLAIVGGGSAREEKAVERLVRGSKAVTLEGALPGAAIAGRLHRATGMALPSLAESFGLVFLEALFAGTPILYPRGTAVDGYFDGKPFAIPVDARDTGSIAEGLARLHREETALKRALAVWQAEAGAERFRRDAIARTFGDGLFRAIEVS